MSASGTGRLPGTLGGSTRIYPGPLGELVYRELTAYAEFGYCFSNNGLIPRLAAAVPAA